MSSSMIRLPPLHSVIAFEAAARLGSFTAAAEELCVTQSAVSHRVRALESWLGDVLFERRHRRIELTESGRAYLVEIREALRLIEAASDRLRREEQRRIRLSAAPGLGSAWLVNQLNDYRAEQPRIEFLITSSTTARALAAGETDVSLLYGAPPWPGAEAFELSREAIFPVCSPALAARLGDPPALHRLTEVPLLRHPLLSWPAWLSANGVADIAQAASYGPSFDDAVMLLEAAAAGAGLALTVNLIVRPYLASGVLVKPFDLSIPGLGFYAVVPHHALAQPWIRYFVRWLHGRAHQAESFPTDETNTGQ